MIDVWLTTTVLQQASFGQFARSSNRLWICQQQL
jgi:hypothetical protein